MDAKSVRNMYSNIAVTSKSTAKLHHFGSFYVYYLMMHGNPNIKFHRNVAENSGLLGYDTLLFVMVFTQFPYCNIPCGNTK